MPEKRFVARITNGKIRSTRNTPRPISILIWFDQKSKHTTLNCMTTKPVFLSISTIIIRTFFVLNLILFARTEKKRSFRQLTYRPKIFIWNTFVLMHVSIKLSQINLKVVVSLWKGKKNKKSRKAFTVQMNPKLFSNKAINQFLATDACFSSMHMHVLSFMHVLIKKFSTLTVILFPCKKSSKGGATKACLTVTEMTYLTFSQVQKCHLRSIFKKRSMQSIFFGWWSNLKGKFSKSCRNLKPTNLRNQLEVSVYFLVKFDDSYILELRWKII